jgi:hypothetical protein
MFPADKALGRMNMRPMMPTSKPTPKSPLWRGRLGANLGDGSHCPAEKTFWAIFVTK